MSTEPPTERRPGPTTSADPLAVLRTRTSVKWTQHPADVLPMFVAEMDYPLAPAIRAALHAAVDAGDTGYVNPARRGAAAAFAGYASDAWGWSVEPGQTAMANEVGVVVVESLRRLVPAGGGVVITPPVYPPFFDYVPEAGLEVVEVPLLDDGQAHRLDLDGIDRALAAGARAVLLCNPHNPLGLVHERADLVRLSEIVESHGASVVSDEIHAPLTHPGVAFTPYLTVSAAARSHAIAAESGSKAFNLAGLKCAFFVAQSDETLAVLRAMPPEVEARTGLFGQLATEAGFTDGRAWLDGTVRAVAANVALLREQLARKLPGVGFRAPRAGYLAWLDLRPLGWGDDPAAVALDRARVALVPGPTFGTQGRGFARMNVACSPEVLVEAVDRLAAAAG